MFIISYHLNFIDIIETLTSAGYDYEILCNYHKFEKDILVGGYFTGIHDQYYKDIISVNDCLRIQKEIIHLMKKYTKTKKYVDVKRELFESTASDIFSYMVLITDSYYKC